MSVENYLVKNSEEYLYVKNIYIECTRLILPSRFFSFIWPTYPIFPNMPH